MLIDFTDNDKNQSYLIKKVNSENSCFVVRSTRNSQSSTFRLPFKFRDMKK